MKRQVMGLAVLFGAGLLLIALSLADGRVDGRYLLGLLIVVGIASNVLHRVWNGGAR